MKLKNVTLIRDQVRSDYARFACMILGSASLLFMVAYTKGCDDGGVNPISSQVEWYVHAPNPRLLEERSFVHFLQQCEALNVPTNQCQAMLLLRKMRQ